MFLQQFAIWLISLVLSFSPTLQPSEPIEAAVVRIAYEQVGKRYVWGGKGPDVFDCSGFVSYVWREAAGIDFRAYTVAQWKNLPHVPIEEIQPGDLIFTRSLGHVYLYAGNGRVLHAPDTGMLVREDPMPPSNRIKSEVVRPSLLAP